MCLKFISWHNKEKLVAFTLTTTPYRIFGVSLNAVWAMVQYVQYSVDEINDKVYSVVEETNDHAFEARSLMDG